MLKTCRRMPCAMLASALLFFAAGAARAQDSNDMSRTTPVSSESLPAPVERGGGQSTKGGAGRTAQSGNAVQASNRPAPLSAGEKIEYSFRRAFLNPVPYVTSALGAGLTQFGEDRLPHKDGGDEVADWGSRAARNFASRSTTTLFASGFYPALFKQDPRYEPSQRKGFGQRTLHAISRVFVTRDDDGHLEPNYSRFAGVATSSALSNIWEHSTPGHDRIGSDATLRRFALSFATGSINNIVFKEFWPDIMKIFRR